MDMTNNKQQTAVRWFLDQLLKDGYIKRLPVLQFQQARKMEKEQLINTWSEATAPEHEIELSDAPYITTQIKKAEQYCNKTYGDAKQ